MLFNSFSRQFWKIHFIAFPDLSSGFHLLVPGKESIPYPVEEVVEVPEAEGSALYHLLSCSCSPLSPCTSWSHAPWRTAWSPLWTFPRAGRASPFLGIYHQFGILVPLLYGELVDDRDLGRIRNGASNPRHRGHLSPFAHISERYDQCPFVGIALSADAEWVTRKEDYDRLPLELHFMVLLFSFVAYSFTMLYSSFSISFHLYFISFLLLNNRSPEEPIIVVM